MNNITRTLAALAVAVLFMAGSARAQDDARWEAFGKNLVVALKGHDNPAVQQAAMQHVVTYGEWIDVREAEFDVMRVFRNSKDENVRLLALGALAKMNSPWAMDMLRRSVRYEHSPRIQRMLAAVLAESYQTPGIARAGM